MYDAELKRLPIGIENFEEIRTDDYYYVDKTNMIRDLLQRRGKVNLFTRPRRFGKSLNMGMLKSFFGMDGDKQIFEGLDISKETALCERYMGKFPVVSISLKSVNGADHATARSLMCSVIGNEALLEKHYGRKVIVLIDEYDVPLAKAHAQGYYDQMIVLIRNLFEQVLKTNDSLYFAVLTGCLRVSKESIFTGLNNLKAFPITDSECDSYFGFTDEEVRQMLTYYNLDDKYDAIKEWYDGYHFGDAECKKAIEQINEKRYADQLYADGMKAIMKCGIACHMKNCRVVFEQ